MIQIVSEKKKISNADKYDDYILRVKDLMAEMRI